MNGFWRLLKKTVGLHLKLLIEPIPPKVNNISFHTAPNGLRIVHLHVPRAGVGHFGIAVKAGSSRELTRKEEGLAHFVEHTLFKGTKKRSAWHILNRMESVGGELGAFTTKEDMVIYTSFPRGSLIRAVDLVVDLVRNSRFPANELEREREVICDEINSYLDSPADAVFDDFEDLLYKGSPLGHNILGTVESVRNITSGMCRDWLRKNYNANNMVAFYSGVLSVESFLKKALPFLESISSTAEKGSEPCCAEIQSATFEIVRNADTHQAHTVMGCSLPVLDTAERVELALLTNMLGGPGMNSLLNVELRERRGLVYTVESSLANWSESNMFTTYFGCDPADNLKCRQLVISTLQSIAESGLSPRRLAAARKQYLGQLLIARENTENCIINVARAILLRGKALSHHETAELLNNTDSDRIRNVAQKLLPLSSLTLMKH